MKKIVLSIIIVIASAQISWAFDIQKVDPTFWWAGMKNTELQLMVYGKDIASATPTIADTDIKIQSVVKLESPNYLLIYLDIAKAKPGKFDILFTQGKQKKTLTYDLKVRNKLPEEHKGFDASDVLYLIMPDRFANGDTSNDNAKMEINAPVDRKNPNGRHGGDLAGIEQHLDYINDLGVTAIWLNPVLENDMPNGSYHGYATTDYYKVDKRFGTNEDYVRLIDKTHQKGMKVVMDMIFNHSGSNHIWMKDKPAVDWFNHQDKYVQTSYRLNSHFDPYASDYDHDLAVNGWFVEEMPDLNQRNPHVAKYLIQNSIWWVEYSGIDGIRMDTHPYADPEMMANWGKTVFEEYPNFNIVGEAWYETVPGVAYWQQKNPINKEGNTYLKSVMDFPMMRVANEAFTTETDAWNGLNKLYDHLTLDFLVPDPSNMLTFLDNHDTDRFLREAPKNLDNYKQAIAFLLTTRGIPQIYYGTELLMHGTKAASDGDIRLDFPGGWKEDKINAFTPEGRTPMQQEAVKYLKTILDWRKGNEAIAKGSLKHFTPTNGIYLYERKYGDKSVIVILNGTSQQQVINSDRYKEVLEGKKTAREVITGKNVNLNVPSFTLAPREVLILDYNAQ